MKLFRCQACEQLVYFENTVCERCRHQLGYLPERNLLAALEPAGDDQWRALASGHLYRFCGNARYAVCNWLIDAASPDPLCLACRHNGTIPDMNVPANLPAWQKIEIAKHRLIYSLLRLGLPLRNRQDAPDDGLQFEFPASLGGGPRVLTGHENGLITIALEEADDVEREARRTALGESYRTLLGHFRHEVGHYYWERLVRDGGRLDAARAVFGDDGLDYGQSLQQYYQNGAPTDWPDSFVTPYATSHPWEDFAETWAHYLHIVDTLEMAHAFGVHISPRLDKTGNMTSEVAFDPYAAHGIQQIVDAWFPICIALNNLNRSMGQPDLYPFVLSPNAARKLGFVHELVQQSSRSTQDAGVLMAAK